MKIAQNSFVKLPTFLVLEITKYHKVEIDQIIITSSTFRLMSINNVFQGEQSYFACHFRACQIWIFQILC